MDKTIRHNKKIIRLNINLFFSILTLIQFGLVIWYGINFKNRTGGQAFLEFLNSFSFGITSILAVYLNIKISRTSAVRVVKVASPEKKVVAQPQVKTPAVKQAPSPASSNPFIPKAPTPSQPAVTPAAPNTPTTPAATPATPSVQQTPTPATQPSAQQPKVQPNVRPQVHIPTVEIPTIQMPKPQLDALMQEEPEVIDSSVESENEVIEEAVSQPAPQQPVNAAQSMDEKQINFLYQFLGQLTSLEEDIKKLKDLRDHNQDNAIVELRNKTSEKIDAQKQYLAPITRASRRSNYVVACCNIIEDFHKKVGNLLDTIDDKTIIMHVNRLRLRDRYFDKFDELYKELEDVRIEYPAPFEG